MDVPNAVVVAYLRLLRYQHVWANPAAAQQHLRDRALRPQAFGPPRRLRRDVTVTVSRREGWPLYRITPTGPAPRGTVIYAHGGGWVNEIAPQHWALVQRIAALAATTVLVPIYPLIPVGSAAEVVPVFSALAAEALADGPAVLAGDSAGGQIALSAALGLRDREGLVLDRSILIAPGLDLSLSNPEIPVVERSDPWLGQPGIRVFREPWRGELDMRDPVVSPLFGDFTGLGAITLFSGTRDILNPDARLLADALDGAGVDVDYHERAGQVHVYPLLPTAEGREARALIVDQVRAAVSRR